MDRKYNENGPDFGFVEEKVQQVQNIIEDAVSSRNYKELNKSITQMVNKTLKQYQKEHPEKVGSVNNERRQQKNVIKEAHSELYGSLGGEKTKSILLIVFGGILAGTMGIGLMTVQIVQMVMQHNALGSTIVTFLGTAGGAGMIAGGCRGLGRISRFKKYIKTLGDRTYCDFETLAHSVGRSVKYVRKDIIKMIEKGWFLEGKTDREETCLITSRETYRQYEATRQALEDRTAKEQSERQKNRESEEKLSPEVREVLERGEEFIRKIHESNDAIPGEEISAKIAKMEEIIDRIFQRAEAHPEIVPDLKKMMDYYLPMTVKLLDAYEEMDGQPVQGENITNSKKEIEATLDTLNEAFAKLLDSVFQDTAWDVSSDISVLQTMLAQEGLTGNDFDTLHRK